MLCFLLRLVIRRLLKHKPDDRPTALELSQSSLLPQRLEDEYFKSALKLMSSSQNVLGIPTDPLI
jgi:eukaryotic translation initiation factor 2-alpha kinase 4